MPTSNERKMLSSNEALKELCDIHLPLRYEKVYLTFLKLADTPLYIQGDDMLM